MDQPQYSDVAPGETLEPSNQSPATPSMPQAAPQYSDVGPGETLESPGEQPTSSTAGAYTEGVGRGLFGPVAPWMEEHIGEIPASEIRQRAEEHPVAAGAGEFTGFVAPAGAAVAARALLKAGKISTATYAAIQAAMRQGTLQGLSETAGKTALGMAGMSTPVTYGAKVGSSILRNAAEMAVVASADEAAKIAYQDQNAPVSMEHALANVGLSSAIGGVMGGTLTAVSPLWAATGGKEWERLTKAVRYHAKATKQAEKGMQDIASDGLPQAFSNISSQTDKFSPQAHAAMEKELKDAGFPVTPALGSYTDRVTHATSTEPSFLVQHDGSVQAKEIINQIGKKYGQQSVIHSTQGPGARINELHFMDGRPMEIGTGLDIGPHISEGGYTDVPGLGRYALGLGQDLAPTQTLQQGLQKAGRHPAVKIGKIGGKEVLARAGDEAGHEAWDSLNDEESALNKAVNLLGPKPPKYMQAAMNGEPLAIDYLNTLREAQHPEVIEGFKNYPKDVANAVIEKAGIRPEEMLNYSNAADGTHLFNTFVKEHDAKFRPIEEALEQREANSLGVLMPKRMMQTAGEAVEMKGLDHVGVKSPFYKIYADYGDRLKGSQTLKELYQMKSELRKSARSLSENQNAKEAYTNIANLVDKTIEQRLIDEGVVVGSEGVMSPAAMLANKRMSEKAYRDFADVHNELNDHLGLPEFRGSESTKNRMRDVGPEGLLKKFSPMGNAEIIPFLQKHYPETAAALQQIELRKFLSKAVETDRGEATINLKKLAANLEGLKKKGAPEYADFILPQSAQDAIQAGQTIMDHIPDIKSSGTAGWAQKLMKHLPASMMGMIAGMMGHNPAAVWLLAEMAEKLQRKVPESMKLAYLKSIANGAEENGAAFKTAVNVMNHSMVGQQKMMKMVESVFKPGVKVAAANQMVARNQDEKLDKTVDQIQRNPEDLSAIAQTNGQLGHYMPAQEQALTMSKARQLQYLASLKPQPQQISNFGKPRQPTPAEISRYKSALRIANDPYQIIASVKDGTISMNDKTDLQNLYPELYQSMVQEMANFVQSAHGAEIQVPYRTQLGLSMFMGVPVDTSLQPQNILEAQKAFTKPAPQQAPVNPKRGTQTLGKSNKTYQTPIQAAEQDRSGGRGK